MSYAFNVGGAGGAQSMGAGGVYFKIPGAPSTSTAVLDIFYVGNAYLRMYIANDATLWCESLVNGVVAATRMSVTALPFNTWCWVATSVGQSQGQSTNQVNFRATQLSGVLYGAVSQGAPNNFGQTWPVTFAIGKSNSNPALATFPVSGGWQLSKPMIHGQWNAFGSGTLSATIVPPASDWSHVVSGSLGGYWNCRGGGGIVSSLHDDSGNSKPLVGSFNLLNDGPFAS